MIHDAVSYVFFSFSHLCIFDVSQHITDSEALMSSALVWKKNWDSKWFTDENCQHHPCHSGNFEKNIASEPFVTRELWFWVSVDFRWSEIGNEERGWISPFSSTYTTVKKYEEVYVKKKWLTVLQWDDQHSCVAESRS